MCRFCRRRGNCAGDGTTARRSETTGIFGGELTGFPHFRQNCEPSGRVVPQALQAKMAVVVARTVSLGGALTGTPHFRQNWEPSGRSAAHLLHNTAGSFSSKATADISTGCSWSDVAAVVSSACAFPAQSSKGQRGQCQHSHHHRDPQNSHVPFRPRPVVRTPCVLRIVLAPA